MNFQKRIEAAIGYKKRNPREHYLDVMFYLSKEFGWTFQEINDAPIPFVIDILNKLKKYKEDKKRQMRKR